LVTVLGGTGKYEGAKGDGTLTGVDARLVDRLGQLEVVYAREVFV
jgi:hypothetical protein